MQINLGTSLSGLRQAIATSSVPDDYTATDPNSYAGSDGGFAYKQFTFRDIPLGYLESVTVTFTISGEIDAGSGQYQAPSINQVFFTRPTYFSSYTQALVQRIDTAANSAVWLESFTGTLGEKSFVINASTARDGSNNANLYHFDNDTPTVDSNKGNNLADQRHTQDSNYTDDGFRIRFNYVDFDEDNFSPTISNVTIDVVYKEAPYEN